MWIHHRNASQTGAPLQPQPERGQTTDISNNSLLDKQPLQHHQQGRSGQDAPGDQRDQIISYGKDRSPGNLGNHL